MGEMGPALVLLHGFTHTGASWDPVIAGLPQRYRALAPDIRGHGAAGDRTPADLPGVIADVAALAPTRFGLVGYSMGGRIALHVALALPERVSALMLIGASPGLADPAERAQRRRDDDALADELQAMTIEAFARRWAQTPVLAGVAPEVAGRAHADRLRSTPAGLARALRGLGTGVLGPVWERLGELSVPVTLVVGERDAKFTAVAQRMADRLRHGQLVVVPGAGHAVHLEAPAVVADLIQTPAAGGRPRGSSARRGGR